MLLSRRDLLGLFAAAAVPTAGVIDLARQASAATPGPDFGSVIDMAEALARSPYEEPRAMLQDAVAGLSYDDYRDIRFRSDRAVWKDQGLGFQVELFHPGFHFTAPVAIETVEDGDSHPLAFSSDLFDYGPRATPPSDPTGLAFSGFRVRNPINRPDVMDEFIVFQGASYFRAVAAGQRYGLSARGLAINTADPGGEEFPHFDKFWLVRPEPGATSLVVLALLDSPSTSGAYRFTLRPGAQTVVDVELVLFPRQQIPRIGLAPLTSMFLFDASTRVGHDDFRDAVHDSDALQILAGSGERIVRPLANPSRLQVSGFIDHNPRGFGLVQRTRRFDQYHDLETRFELRPSAWVEPIGDWGRGAVVLVEIPSDSETNDNIVTYWRPLDGVQPGRPFNLTYRLHWCQEPQDGGTLARAVSTRGGLSFDRERRLFVVEFAGLAADPATPTIDVSASKGSVVNVVGRSNPVTGAYRVSFELDTGGETLVELRLVLLGPAGPLSETWLYRWTAQ